MLREHTRQPSKTTLFHMHSGFRTAFLIIGWLVAAVLYQLCSLPLPTAYKGFTELTWQSLDGCVEIDDFLFPNSTVRRIATWDKENPTHQATCLSAPFALAGNSIEVQFTGKASKRAQDAVRLELLRADTSQVVHVWQIPKEHRLYPSYLMRDSASVPDRTSMYQLRIVDHASDIGWLVVRPRVDFYTTSAFMTWFKRTQAKLSLDPIAAFLLAMLSALLVIVLMPTTPLRTFWLFCMLSLAVHLRFYNFFYLDDWLILERLYNHGLRHVFEPQNEHFIPIFTSIFTLQFAIFREHYAWYVFVAAALNAYNGVLITRVFRLLFNDKRQYHAIAIALGAIYVAHGFHAEVIQWLTSTCTIWSIVARLQCYLNVIRFVRSQRTRDAVACVLWAGLGPLIFGGNFSLCVEIPFIAMLAFCTTSKRIDVRSFLFRTAVIQVPVVVTYGIEAWLYVHFRGSDGIARVTEAAVPTFGFAAKYIMLGSQFGALLRTLAGSNILTISDAATSVFSRLAVFFHVSVEAALIFAGVTTAVLLLVATLRYSQHRLQALSFLVAGQCIMVMPFALSAVVRHQFGLDYAFHLRYYSASLIGVLFAICPLLCAAADRVERYHRFALRAMLCGFVFVVLHNGIQIANRYYLLQLAGQRDRLFIAQLRDWNSRIGRVPFDHQISYEGASTKLVGLQPFFYWGNALARSTTQSPDRHPDKSIAYLTTSLLPHE